MPWTIEQKIFIVEAYIRQKSIHAAQLQFKEWFGCRGFPVHSIIYRWVNSSGPMGLCIASVVKYTTRHSPWTTETIKDTTERCCCRRLLSTAQASLCVSGVRSLESTGAALGRRRGAVRVLQWLQQDGATPHTSNESLAWLQQRFSDRLISRRCDPQWSPHSPHLNPSDFYMWGYLKDRVYGNNPQTIPDL